MVVRDHTVTKEGDLHEMGSRIKEDVHGEVMFLQLSSIHLLPLLSQKVRKRERRYSRQKKHQHVQRTKRIQDKVR